MANSKLLKEAIADAKAVRETAIANAKIALEEAFTPQLQSILSKKLQAEMEEEDDEDVMDETDSSDIGTGDNEDPSADASDAHTELGTDTEKETATVGNELEEGDYSDEDEELEEADGVGYDDPTNADDASISEEDEDYEDEEMDDDELDLESIIKELEMDMDDEDDIEMDMDEEEDMDFDMDDEDDMEMDEEEDMEADLDDEAEMELDDEDDEIDLDEILREMGYGDDEDDVDEGYHEGDDDEYMDEKYHEMEDDLEEAYTTIKKLQGTINEVNLLNAKLLYANRLFRSYNLNNQQKGKVVENLDRTTSVREVKLVYATLAESMGFGGSKKKSKKVVAESASRSMASTKPSKEIISENSNAMANRFKELANIK